MLSQHIKHTLPTELHGTPCIYRSITEAVLTVLPCRASLSLQLCLNVSFIMLRLCRNHSAFNSHNFPRTYTTTYPYVAAPPQPNALTRKAQGFGNYRSRLLSFLWPYFTALFHAVFFLATRDWSLSLPFQLRALHEPRHLSVGHGVITATAYSPPLLPLCIQYIQPTYRDCSLHVPRRLWKVRDSNPRVSASSHAPWQHRLRSVNLPVPSVAML